MTAHVKPARRVATAVALAAGAAIALSACGSGQISQTATQVAAVNGNETEVGALALRNVHLVQTEPDAPTEPGGSANLAFWVTNTHPSLTDRLVSIDTDYADAVEIDEGTGSLELSGKGSLAAYPSPEDAPAADVVAQSEAESDTTNNDVTGEPVPSGIIEVTLTGLSEDVRPGLTFPVTFEFERAGSVTIEVPVDAGPVLERYDSDFSGEHAEGAVSGH
ncbi:hypothetical protein DW322_02060 [Rhodococcus rhodnii]|uniref:Lipoprotein n=2 Tax=Rhodococcus rhodnii TaxID=38312 RepID=R7WMK4_9NOCA|nr:hypothetical protein [Rhodococcus rhodnii]EOM75229.1 hypothetical protein Rrhod_3450 [Rhodococcus rhodnii LMG 5362]TXG89249.1 hypothetical protein DW322_02060 [Rhodococcus rhodnii]